MLLNSEVKEINGYKIFKIDDDGVYVSKSKNELMDYVRKYGDIEYIFGVTEQELFDEIEDIDILSEDVITVRDYGSDFYKSIYDLYVSIAAEDKGTQIILSYNL